VIKSASEQPARSHLINSGPLHSRNWLSRDGRHDDGVVAGLRFARRELGRRSLPGRWRGDYQLTRWPPDHACMGRGGSTVTDREDLSRRGRLAPADFQHHESARSEVGRRRHHRHVDRGDSTSSSDVNANAAIGAPRLETLGPRRGVGHRASRQRSLGSSAACQIGARETARNCCAREHLRAARPTREPGNRVAAPRSAAGHGRSRTCGIAPTGRGDAVSRAVEQFAGAVVSGRNCNT
jgi:hypothetical protein